jgi:pyruvate/2-oxoglutarate dehydrogenase complex dihydrolipoamide acyltransferase (E2) component
MAAALRMPDLGTVEGDVVLVRWLKAEGDSVALGEPLFEVETDKGVSEVECALAGELVKLVVAAGARAGAGEIIAYIRQPGEPAGDVPGTAAGQGAPPRKIAPAIRALAEKWGVDLSTVAASGPGGLVTREDVLRVRGPMSAAAARAPTAHATAPARAGSLSRHQASIARAVAQSHREKPAFRVNAAVDMTRAVAFREQGRQSGGAVRYDAIFVKAAAAAIAEHPVLRSWMKGDEVVEHPDITVAFAVGVGDELYAPAVKAADRKGVNEISGEMDGLARKAEGRSLLAPDTEGSCFLVSNLGMFPISSFDSIIYPEHSAALAVGAITPTPVADAGGVRAAPLAVLTLTVDHRLINGRRAAQFLARVKEILETGAFA